MTAGGSYFGGYKKMAVKAAGIVGHVVMSVFALFCAVVIFVWIIWVMWGLEVWRPLGSHG